MPRRIQRPCLALAAYFALVSGHVVAQTPRPEERVAVEVRFLAITPRLVDKYLKDGSPLTFDAAKVRELLGDVQGDVGASVLHYLKLTATGGQQYALRANGDQQADGGVELSVLPVVSTDRRSVRVALEAELMPAQEPYVVVRVGHPDGSFEEIPGRPKAPPIAVNVSFSAPDGRTVVFEAGTRTRTVSKTETVPYLGWLFTRATETAREERILILVTPRIVSQKPN